MLARGLVIGTTIAALLVLLKPLLMPLCLLALGAQGDVLEAASIYAGIRYWTAPGVILNLALIGFLVGRRRMTAVLIIEVIYNALNVALGLFLALELEWGIAGIGWSSFIAEYIKFAILIALILYPSSGRRVIGILFEKATISWSRLRPFLSTNRDLFLRTLVLTVALAAITRLSAERGPEVLAANGVIYQLFVFTALLLDGFENAAQVLNGERKGDRDRAGFSAYTKAILWRGVAAAALLSFAFILFANPIVTSFAATPEVARIAQDQAMWLIVIPFAGVASFVFDGVFVGASWTRAMLLSMVGASMLFALSLWLTWPLGLWASFVLFLAVRAGLQAAMIPSLIRRSFSN